MVHDYGERGAGKGQNITTQTTTLVKTGDAVLERIIINKATANGTIAVYDDVTAVAENLKATITSPATLLHSQVVIEYGMKMNNGITIVTGAANQDITVVYR
jgi:hypothetical protein